MTTEQEQLIRDAARAEYVAHQSYTALWESRHTDAAMRPDSRKTATEIERAPYSDDVAGYVEERLAEAKWNEARAALRIAMQF